MKNKGNAFIAGLLMTMPIVAGAQQTEPLTGQSRLFNDGKQLFMRHVCCCPTDIDALYGFG